METVELKTEGIRQFVQDLWGSMLGLEPTSAEGKGDWAASGGCYTAWVRIIGGINLTVILKSSEGLARKSASLMMETSEAEITSDQAKDSLKELANILGGNVKGMMAKYHFLSLPAVSELNQEPRLPEGEALCDFHFQCQDHPFQLTVLRTD